MREGFDRLAHYLAGTDPSAVRVRVAGAAVIAAAALLVAATCVGCGGASQTARAVINSGATVLVEVDRVSADAYRDAAARALADSETLADYRVAMRPYDAVADALVAAAAALDVLDALVIAWDAGGAGRWGDAARAALDAFGAVLRVLRAVDVEAPESLYAFIGSIVEVE